MNAKRKKLTTKNGHCWCRNSGLMWAEISILLLTILVTTLANAASNLTCDNCRSSTVHRTSISELKQQFENQLEDDELDLKIWSAIDRSLHQWEQNKQLKQQNDLRNGAPRRRIKRDEESVCYQNFGCFRDEGPFDYLDTLPASPESIATTFMLYTRKNPTKGQLLDYDNQTSVFKSNFNASNDVKIIIHGFGSSSRRPWVLQMTEALLYLDDFNVINVDWQNGSRMPNYVQAAANTQLIGKQIAKLIRLINFVSPLTPSRYHLIGFSLGAHVAGFTGMEIRNISRITGLDPASPLFEGYPPRVRLDPTDANFVDVIHSNGDSFIRGGLGSYAPMGHVDFYPNGGRVQVGCNSVLMGAITDIFYGKWNSLCNHRRAFRFFIDSVVRTCTFRSFACSSYEDYVKGNCFTCGSDQTECSNMGYFAYNSKGRGNMYLVTRDKEPFCVNQYRIQLKSSSRGQGTSWGRIEIQLLNHNGLNETFSITQEADELKEGSIVQALIVAHPEITNVTGIMLTYTRYKGWIYNGHNDWFIDRIELLDSHGNINSYCHPHTQLANTVLLRLSLQPGNCTLPPMQGSAISMGNSILASNSNSGTSTVSLPEVHTYLPMTPPVQFFPFQAQSTFYPSTMQYTSTPFGQANSASTVFALMKPLTDGTEISPDRNPTDRMESGGLNLLNNEIESSTSSHPTYNNYFWQFLSSFHGSKPENYTDDDRMADENRLVSGQISLPLFEEIDIEEVDKKSGSLETSTIDAGLQYSKLEPNSLPPHHFQHPNRRSPSRKRESRQHWDNTMAYRIYDGGAAPTTSSVAPVGHHRIHYTDVSQRQPTNNSPRANQRHFELKSQTTAATTGRGSQEESQNNISAKEGSVASNDSGTIPKTEPTAATQSGSGEPETADNGDKTKPTIAAAATEAPAAPVSTRKKVSTYLLNKTTQFLLRLMYSNMASVQHQPAAVHVHNQTNRFPRDGLFHYNQSPFQPGGQPVNQPIESIVMYPSYYQLLDQPRNHFDTGINRPVYGGGVWSYRPAND